MTLGGFPGGIYGGLGQLGAVRKTGPVPWYLAGGVDQSDCLAAYQAIGAASLAASYVNLANPGVYDAAPGVAPNIDADGWGFTGSQWLTTGGINPNGTNKQYSAFVRFSGATNMIAGQALLGSYNANDNSFLLFLAGNVLQWYSSNFRNSTSPRVQQGVVGIAGSGAYLNGALYATIGAGFNIASGAITIAGTNGTRLLAAGKIQAVAIYNTPMTDPQAQAISAAMAAL